MTKIKVEFGETKLEARLEATGTLRHFTKLSPSFALFALDLEEAVDYGNYFQLEETFRAQATTRILDVIMTRRDGWTKDVIDETMMHAMDTENRQISVTGYPERRQEKSSENSYIFCIHAVGICLVESGRVYEKEPEESRNDHGAAATTESSGKMTPSTCAAGTGPTMDTGTESDSKTEEKSNTGSESTKIDGCNHRNHREQKTSKAKPKNSDRGANDASRFAKLAFFLLSEFGGYEGLSQKPILDVAGGSGGLAFELTVRHQLPCTVVDTRPIQFSAGQKRHLEFRKQSYNALNSVNETTPLVENLKGRFQAGTTDDGLLRQFQTLLETESVLKGLPSSKIKKRADFEKTSEELRKLLMGRGCSVMVGLHPDQALDPIMDIGFALNLPWVVVPCCVFPNLFKQRRLQPSGKPVRTYDDLCEYVLQQHSNVKEFSLPFRGRNRVFYWKPAKEEMIEMMHQ